ncbi:MAG: extradiol dioxygenase [Myxococcota bacterium]
MIDGAHVVVHSTDAEADRLFLRDVLGLPGVDVGGGWLTFGLPPTEVAVHPAGASGRHELFFLCSDIERFLGRMGELEVPVSALEEEPWGRLVRITLPGGGQIGVYQPLRERAPAWPGKAGAVQP